MQLTLQANWTPDPGDNIEFCESLEIAGLVAYVFFGYGDVWRWQVSVLYKTLFSWLANEEADSKAEAKDDAEAFIRKTLAEQVVT